MHSALYPLLLYYGLILPPTRLGPLGPYGPLGPLGPLGYLGPLGPQFFSSELSNGTDNL